MDILFVGIRMDIPFVGTSRWITFLKRFVLTATSVAGTMTAYELKKLEEDSFQIGLKKGWMIAFAKLLVTQDSDADPVLVAMLEDAASIYTDSDDFAAFLSIHIEHNLPKNEQGEVDPDMMKIYIDKACYLLGERS